MNITKHTYLVLLIVLSNLTACVNREIHDSVQDSGPQVVFAPIPAANRITVAVSRFTNESIYGSGLFTDQNGDRIGKQAADLLSRQLLASQHFNVVERQDINKLKLEADLMGVDPAEFKKNLQGVDALIMGSVVELGRDTTGGMWLLGKEKTQRARARVVLKLLDTQKRHVFYSQ